MYQIHHYIIFHHVYEQLNYKLIYNNNNKNRRRRRIRGIRRRGIRIIIRRELSYINLYKNSNDNCVEFLLYISLKAISKLFHEVFALLESIKAGALKGLIANFPAILKN